MLMGSTGSMPEVTLGVNAQGRRTNTLCHISSGVQKHATLTSPGEIVQAHFQRNCWSDFERRLDTGC